MWLLLAFTSALLLGLYDVAKKQALRDNAVLPVLLLNTLFSSLLFLPTILSTDGGWGWFLSLIHILFPFWERSRRRIVCGRLRR